MAGFDRYFGADDDFMLGVYLRYGKDDITQQDNKADMQKTGVGLYGGLIKQGWELKAMLLGSYDQANISRDVLGIKAKSKLNAITLNADVEAALRYALNKNLDLRPFIGAEAQNVNYPNFNETGAQVLPWQISYNLYVKGGNYLRTAARIGTDLEYEKGKWSWNFGIEAKYLISGYQPEIESVKLGLG